MDINKLYEELGREIAKRTALNIQRSTAQREWRETIVNLDKQINASNCRAAELYEAISMASDDTVDPLVAKMTAKESLEDNHDHDQIRRIFDELPVEGDMDRHSCSDSGSCTG